jgi:transposase-like protein
MRDHLSKPLPEPEYWRAKEAARFLGVAPSTLYNWIDRKRCSLPIRGRPPYARFGKIIVFPIVKLKLWAKQREQDAPDQHERR